MRESPHPQRGDSLSDGRTGTASGLGDPLVGGEAEPTLGIVEAPEERPQDGERLGCDLPVVSAPARGQELGCHIALEDVSGDSAIVEPIDGKLRVHHAPQYQVVANDPPFDEQLEHLRHYRPFGGDRLLPG